MGKRDISSCFDVSSSHGFWVRHIHSRPKRFRKTQEAGLKWRFYLSNDPLALCWHPWWKTHGNDDDVTISSHPVFPKWAKTNPRKDLRLAYVTRSGPVRRGESCRLSGGGADSPPPPLSVCSCHMGAARGSGHLAKVRNRSKEPKSDCALETHSGVLSALCNIGLRTFINDF